MPDNESEDAPGMTGQGKDESWFHAFESELSRGLERLERAVAESAASARTTRAALDQFRILGRFFSDLDRKLDDLRTELDATFRPAIVPSHTAPGNEPAGPSLAEPPGPPAESESAGGEANEAAALEPALSASPSTDAETAPHLAHGIAATEPGAEPSTPEREPAAPIPPIGPTGDGNPQAFAAARPRPSTATAFLLRLESAGGDVNLPAVDEAARDLPGIIDIVLLDYHGTRTTLRVVAEGEEMEARQLVDELLRAVAGANELNEVTVTPETDSSVQQVDP